MMSSVQISLLPAPILFVHQHGSDVQIHQTSPALAAHRKVLLPPLTSTTAWPGNTQEYTATVVISNCCGHTSFSTFTSLSESLNTERADDLQTNRRTQLSQASEMMFWPQFALIYCRTGCLQHESTRPQAAIHFRNENTNETGAVKHSRSKQDPFCKKRAKNTT